MLVAFQDIQNDEDTLFVNFVEKLIAVRAIETSFFDIGWFTEK